MNKKKLFAVLACFVFIFSLTACGGNENEEETELGTIQEETSEEVTSSETFTYEEYSEATEAIEGIMSENKENISLITTNLGSCYYDTGFEFEGYTADTELQETTMIVSIPESIIDSTFCTVVDKSVQDVQKKEVLYNTYKITGVTGNYIAVHLVAGKDIDLTSLSLKLVSNTNSADFILIPITTFVSSIPDDISAKLISFDGEKKFYYIGKELVEDTVEDGGDIFVEGYNCIFLPINCSFSDFPYENMSMKLADTVEKNIKRCIEECKLNNRVDIFDLGGDGGTGNKLSPVINIVIKYDYIELRQFYGNFWAEKLAVIGDNLGFYYNNQLICNL